MPKAILHYLAFKGQHSAIENIKNGLIAYV